jgi:hypothetical protein
MEAAAEVKESSAAVKTAAPLIFSAPRRPGEDQSQAWSHIQLAVSLLIIYYH